MPQMKGISNSQVADSNADLSNRPSKTRKRVSISLGETSSKDVSNKQNHSNIVFDFSTPENQTSLIDRDIIENLKERESRRNSRASKNSRGSANSYLQTLHETLENGQKYGHQEKNRLSNDLEYGSMAMSQNDSSCCSGCMNTFCCWSILRDDPANCKKRCVDYSLLISILCLFIVTLIGYIIILQLADSTDQAQDTLSSEFSGYVPMPNLNKTIEGAPYYENSFGQNANDDNSNKNQTLLTTREFWMQCKYSNGADRFMFSCIQLDEHFVLKSKEEIEDYVEN